MAYNPAIPQSNQLLSTSQQDILNNFSALNTVYGVDHYAYNDSTPNATFHKKVTTPDQTTDPATVTNPAMYARTFSGTNLGLLQYSKGPDRLTEGVQVPTPLTAIQSSSTALSLNKLITLNVFDFTGITRCFGRFYVGNMTSNKKYFTSSTFMYFFAGGSPNFAINNSGDTATLTVLYSGVNLTVTNNTGTDLNHLYWTIEFDRIQIT